jgi:SAM-dependent methyltransferase
MLNTLLHYFAGDTSKALMSENQMQDIREAFGEALSLETIQGWAYHKPLGYAGDFQIIEKIYTQHTSSNPHLAKWDQFSHHQTATKAIRNRISFFLDQVWKAKTQATTDCHILNLASGPGRDMLETLNFLGARGIHIDCVEQDPQAIKYAMNLCKNFLAHIQFFQKNVLRFTTNKTYHLIWSGGLFDYFNDSIFKRILRRLLSFLKTNGKLIIGNFSTTNPSRGYMDLFHWNLIHRTREELRQLARDCGVPDEKITIEQEPEGINLFLVITN